MSASTGTAERAGSTRTMTEALLPEGFEDLAPFLDWALEPERARTAKKAETSMEELRAFYDAMMPRLGEIMACLDSVPDGDERPAPAHRLYLMSLSLVEVANLVEIYKRRKVIEACDPLHFNPQR